MTGFREHVVLREQPAYMCHSHEAVNKFCNGAVQVYDGITLARKQDMTHHLFKLSDKDGDNWGLELKKEKEKKKSICLDIKLSQLLFW